jgi:hypothetical protein
MLQPGQTFRDYRLIEKIGRGGMGEMWLAVKLDHSGGDFKRFAVKVLLPELVEDDEFVRMFVGEARLAANLEHPNVVQVFEFGDHEDQLWFSQEFVEGCNLRELMRAAGGGLPYPLAALVVGEILEALVYAHEMRGADGQTLRIVHRDIKPSNVLVSNLGHVKLADFGIAKRLGDSVADVVHTKTGHVRGTIGYMAPELLLGARATHLSDLYAVGIVLWELLTGHRLFSGEDRLRKNIEAQIPPLRSQNVDVPPELERVVMTMLCRDPRGRPQTAQLAQQALRGAPGGRDAMAAEFRSYLAALAASGRLVSVSTEVAERATKTFRQRPRGQEAENAAAPAAVRAGAGAVGATGSASMELGAVAQVAPSVPRMAFRAGVHDASSTAASGSGTAATVAGLPTSKRRTMIWNGTKWGLAVAAAAAVGIGGVLAYLAAQRRGEQSMAAPSTLTGGGPDQANTMPSVASPTPVVPQNTPPVAITEPDAALNDVGDAGVVPVAAASGTPAAQRSSFRPLPPGALVVKVKPWAQVYVDGHDMGATPINKELTPGRHRVKLVNEERHQEETMTVTVTSGETSVLERHW